MSQPENIAVECDNASLLYARLVSETRALELLHIWGEITGQRDLLDVKSIGEAADIAGLAQFRRFVQQVSGGLWRALELVPETVSEEEKRSFRELEPPEDEFLQLPWAEFADDPLLRVCVTGDGFDGEWREHYNPPVAACHDTSWLAEVTRKGGCIGSKLRPHLPVALADQLTTSVVFWYQYMFARVYQFPVSPESDLGLALTKDPGEIPRVITLKSAIFGPKVELLLGIEVNGELRACGDVAGPWTSDDDFAPCRWGWSQPSLPPKHHFFEDGPWCWR